MNVPAKCKELGIEKIIFGPMLREEMERNSAYVLNAIAVHDDLLAQLQRTLTDLEDFCSDEPEFEWTPEAGQQMIREIEKAIAKAKGA
jgi:hypothetical protein